MVKKKVIKKSPKKNKKTKARKRQRGMSVGWKI